MFCQKKTFIAMQEWFDRDVLDREVRLVTDVERPERIVATRHGLGLVEQR